MVPIAQAAKAAHVKHPRRYLSIDTAGMAIRCCRG